MSESDPQQKCSLCKDSKCCTYTTHHLDTPRSKQDFELLLWQVSHRGVELYQDGDGWFLLINGSCEHLIEGGGCTIYTNRPTICRDHSNDYCEYDSAAEEGFKRHFRNYQALLDYCRKRFKRWDS